VSSKLRRVTIANRLLNSGEASITELAQTFGTSEMTIRRDLELLEAEGLARRVRGGAISTQSRSYQAPILQRSAHECEAKQRIGEAAAELLAPGETTIIDGGTTTLQMVRAINPGLGLTIITSSLLIATELDTKPEIRVMVTGGKLRHGEMSLVGSRAEASFVDLNCDSVFIGAAGLSEEKGITEYNMEDTEIKLAAIRSSRRVVVLADASKMGQVAFVNVAPLGQIDLIVTNASPHNRTILAARELGVEILHVEPVAQEIAS
jgi:DeoR/GlpR family transcriptional regulator of sugar metabolism